MRIISFTEMWPKLKEDRFTTMRYPYWQLGWDVQVFFKSRSKLKRRKLGEATIVGVESVAMEETASVRLITDEEARGDGFLDRAGMVDWMHSTYRCNYSPVMDMLTLVWRSRERICGNCQLIGVCQVDPKSLPIHHGCAKWEWLCSTGSV